jgi:hypothetical protein
MIIVHRQTAFQKAASKVARRWRAVNKPRAAFYGFTMLGLVSVLGAVASYTNRTADLRNEVRNSCALNALRNYARNITINDGLINMVVSGRLRGDNSRISFAVDHESLNKKPLLDAERPASPYAIAAKSGIEGCYFSNKSRYVKGGLSGYDND